VIKDKFHSNFLIAITFSDTNKLILVNNGILVAAVSKITDRINM
jgi:hypothetical protein